MKIEKWINENTYSLAGKTVAVTGSTGGLGQQVCFYLAELGANFIFLNRNLVKSKALEDKILEKFPNCKIEHFVTDMEDIASVERAGEFLKEKRPDVLILNAGAYKVQPQKVFKINLLAPYKLASVCDFAKVVIVGSLAHKWAKLTDKCKKDIKIYGLSKRFLMFALTEKFKGKKFAIAHPGVAYTNITSHYPQIFIPFIKFFMKIIFPSTKKASLSIVKAVFDDSEYGTWIGPRIFDVWGKPKHKKIKTFSSEEGLKMLDIVDKWVNGRF